MFEQRDGGLLREARTLGRYRWNVSFTYDVSYSSLTLDGGYFDKGRLEILCDCADGIDRDGDLDLGDAELDAYRDKKCAKEFNQLEVAIGDGMEFTIHGKRVVVIMDPIPPLMLKERNMR